MNYLIYGITLLVLVSVTAVMSRFFSIYNAIPFLLLIFIVSLAAARDSFDFFFAGLVGGLYLDLASGLPPGTMMAGFAIIGSLIHALYHQVTFYEFNWKHLLVLVSLAFIAMKFWIIGFVWLVGQFNLSAVTITLSGAAQKAFFEWLYTLIMSYPIFAITQSIITSINERERRRHTLY